MKPGRNDPCPCGSGRKYKQCCQGKPPAGGGQADVAQLMQAAVAQHNAGQLAQAEATCRQVLQINAAHPDALNLMGLIAYQTGHVEEAANLIRQAISVNKRVADYHNNLGNIVTALGHVGEAEACFREVLRLAPSAEAHNNLGGVLQRQGRVVEAIECYRQAVKLSPDNAVMWNNLGSALQAERNADEAMHCYRRALDLAPNYLVAQFNLGCVLVEKGRHAEGIELYRRLIEIEPSFVMAHINLGNALNEQGEHGEAAMCFHRTLELNPDFAEAHNNLGNALSSQGEFDSATESYRRAVELKPDLPEAHSNLLFLYAYHASLTPSAYLAEARKWEQACVPEAEREAARRRTFRRAALAGRRLKVGYVSGDYRKHPVSDNIEQLFAQHERTRIELYAYSASGFRDAVTERLQGLAEHWVPLMGLPDAAARERIDADGIDVLVDLSGHTASNRLGVFARRAAPVQVYYLGYFASTGLTEMDYLIGDEILTPAETDSHFSERVWRLPRIWESYNNQADAPAPGWRPAPDGGIWLGSFNNLGKLTPATLALWARVLHALPQAKLLLKTKELADEGNRGRILQALGGHGIEAGRIELRDWSVTPQWSSHMAYYDRLDIALDPVGGMAGGNTTCEALWMGVPVITLLGDRMSSRITATIVNAVGQAQWIARSEGEYIDKVVGLARDVEGRKGLRAGQRAQMAASPLCDARGLARLLEQGYAEMFERWAYANH